ncbi:MAG: hypothetical protein KDD47_24985, partial [Acidobacteria bacterium]|nr:hypothetical protein [Acidobacteriota bacterium]
MRGRQRSRARGEELLDLLDFVQDTAKTESGFRRKDRGEVLPGIPDQVLEICSCTGSSFGLRLAGRLEDLDQKAVAKILRHQAVGVLPPAEGV